MTERNERARECLAAIVERDAAQIHDYNDGKGTAYHIRDGAGAKVWAGTAIRAMEAFSTQEAALSGGGETYAAFQQRRGRLPDLIEEAIAIYDGFMKDDDYNAQGCLDSIVAKLRSARDWYDATPIAARADSAFPNDTKPRGFPDA